MLAEAIRAILWASAMAASFVGRLVNNAASYDRRCCHGFWHNDDGERTGREQAAQITIALSADTAELVLAPLECCFRTSPIHAENSRPDQNAFGSATLVTGAVASVGPMPATSSSPAHLIGSVPGHDPTIKLR